MFLFPLEIITCLKSLDKDECGTIQDICGFGTCNNLPGSYSCVCNRGYRYDANTKRCVGKLSKLFDVRFLWKSSVFFS